MIFRFTKSIRVPLCPFSGKDSIVIRTFHGFLSIFCIFYPHSVLFSICISSLMKFIAVFVINNPGAVFYSKIICCFFPYCAICIPPCPFAMHFPLIIVSFVSFTSIFAPIRPFAMLNVFRKITFNINFPIRIPPFSSAVFLIIRKKYFRFFYIFIKPTCYKPFSFVVFVTGFHFQYTVFVPELPFAGLFAVCIRTAAFLIFILKIICPQTGLFSINKFALFFYLSVWIIIGNFSVSVLEHLHTL